MPSLAPYTGTLDLKKSAHLLRRTTFGPTRKMIDALVGHTANQALNKIYQAIPTPVIPNWLESLEDVDKIDQFRKWSLNLMREGGSSGIEKMVFFLHTIFTTRISVVDNYLALYYQNTLLRYYSLGNIKELAKKISVDSAMLILLDGQLNVKGSPNENYARELFELYTIGKGVQKGAGDYTNFTEHDIKEAAKVLSGWKVVDDFQHLDPETSIPQGKMEVSQHDFSTKTFSPAFQSASIIPSATSGVAGENAAIQELDDLIELIFAQKETAKNICRKIYRFFIYYKITEEIERDIIEPLANILITSNYEIRPVLFQLLGSKHFYDDDTAEVNSDNNRSAIIKSPLEIVLGTLRFFEADVHDIYQHNLLENLFQQGLDLYEPFDVAGYDPYHQAPAYNRNWITSNNLARRYEFAERVIPVKDQTMRDPAITLDIVKYVEDPQNITDPFDVNVLASEIITYLLPEAISEVRFQFFINLLNDGLPSSNWTMEWNMYKNNGDDTVVRKQLELFVNQLLQSPEYQLF